ncbi:SDR family NAD(P)-dependent oxidoreductase [Mycolicibacterium mengxianglii]|uniref:SDR family NAD(P)-dependent oxidoreductase n=1 Tax=Mycolicibacterium mengxianglii TaxID=2736649 RepID=UPI0018EF005C|nr:SDR family NAD(P)-dependent oxidoreductase [Mycolicibacterium mengxianglii]
MSDTSMPSWVMVTGAAGGIGREIVRELLDAGHHVLATDREQPEFGDHGEARLRTCALDVTSEADINELMIEQESAGSISALVTAAGIQKTGASESYDINDWQRVISVNLTGTWLPIRAVLPSMLERGAGRIITISSEIGIAGAANYAAYAASKGGVIALTKSLAREYARRGLVINSVAPGPIEAGIFLGNLGHNPEWLEHHVPAGRFGAPRDVSSVVRFLLSGDADYFVGQVLSPNGGVVI